MSAINMQNVFYCLFDLLVPCEIYHWVHKIQEQYDITLSFVVKCTTYIRSFYNFQQWKAVDTFIFILRLTIYSLVLHVAQTQLSDCSHRRISRYILSTLFLAMTFPSTCSKLQHLSRNSWQVGLATFLHKN